MRPPLELVAARCLWSYGFQQGLGYLPGKHDFPVGLTGATPSEATPGPACPRVPGQYLPDVTRRVVGSQCVAVGEVFDQGEQFGYQENPGRQVKPQFSHKKANKSSQKPPPAKLRGERQLQQGSQQVSLYPGPGCAGWGLHLLPRALPRVEMLRVLSPKIRWEFPGRTAEVMKAAAPLFCAHAQPQRSPSHVRDALLSFPISRPSLKPGRVFLWRAATRKPLSVSLLPQTGGDECALGKPLAGLAPYEHPPQCTFELIPPAFVCLADKTSQQCLEKSLMRDHCLHNKARLPLQMFSLH